MRYNACQSTMESSLTRQMLRCTRSSCRREVSIRTGTFFAGSKVPCSKVMFDGLPVVQQDTCKRDYDNYEITGHFNKTVGLFQNHFRQLVSGRVQTQTEDMMIGGNGVIIEIDESKLGKRKFNRGHQVEGIWVLGGVERTPERRVFLVQVEKGMRAPCWMLSISMLSL